VYKIATAINSVI